MHKGFIAIILTTLILVLTPQAQAVQCCVDGETLTCTEGDDLECTGDDATLYEGQTCSVVEEEGEPICASGCCCATSSAQNPGDWNLDEEGMNMIGLACGALGSAYDFEMPGAGETCVDVCADAGGEGPGEPGETHEISGVVTNGTDPLQDATAYFPWAGSAYQDTTGTDGEFSIQAPPNQGYLIATRAGCVPHSQELTLEGPETGLEIEMDCTTSACTPDSDPTIEAAIVRGSDDVRLTMSADNSCGGFEHYRIIRENQATGATQALPEITTNEHTDEGLEPQTEYCYTIAARYASGLHPSDPAERPEACITTGDEACMQDREEDLEWCENTQDGSAILACDENNNLVEDECSENQICAQGPDDAPQCMAQPPCEQCNGLFGFLGNLLFSIFHQGATFQCTSEALENFCYEDRTDTTTDAYQSCAIVDNCEDYRSEDACTSDPCMAANGCEWTDVYPELGKGVCTSTTEPASCSECDDLFGSCTRDLCEAIGGGEQGECYYVGENNGFNTGMLDSRCIHEDAMACRYYDTQTHCTADTSGVTVDADYNGDERTGGTHEVTTQSDDRMSIGLCDWYADETISAGGRCYKDADEHTRADPEDDCIERGYFASYGLECLSDSEPPTTQLLIPTEPVGTHEIASLEYTVSDNLYTNDDITTNFCLAEQESDCYPSSTLSETLSQLPEMEVGEERDFTIKYYSYDGSSNLEIVQEDEITIIELGYPRLVAAELRG